MASPSHRVRRTPTNTQHIYDLGRRIHDVKTYPVLSPQGATILLYGHENGLTIIWRGGQRLKSPEPSSARKASNAKPNGAKEPEDAIMIIDSDDDEPQPTTAAAAAGSSQGTDKVEFESQESNTGFPETVQTLDLSFATDVFHIAVPSIAQCAPEGATIDILQEKMVFAVSCGTADLHILTLPLTPPSHESKTRPELRKDLLAGRVGRGNWGETLISLNGQGKASNALAITFDQRKTSTVVRSKSAERLSGGAAPATVIVAAHCPDAAGTLRFWDVNLDRKRSSTERPAEPFQTEYLPSPLSGIAFNPKHPSQLLAIDSPNAVRIYDYSKASLADDVSEGRFPTQGSWLLSLYPPFARGSIASLSRKRVVAAAWISNGRGILTLLADGQWGIWDVAGAGPTSTSNGIFGKATAGIRGAALTAFSASGQLEGTSPLRNPATQKAGGEFVPMTPHTRRDVQTLSFAGGPERLAAIHGGIEVLQLPSQRGGHDESAVLWLGGVDYTISLVPNVARYWESQTRKSGAGGAGSVFSGAQPSRMIRIADLQVGLMGEQCTGVGLVARPQGRPGNEDDDDQHFAADIPVEVVVQGESRLVMVRESEDGVAPLTSRLLAVKKRKLGPAPAAEPVSAIIVHSQPEKPRNVTFNLSIAKRGSLRAPRQTAKSLFQPDLDRNSGKAVAPAAEEPYNEEVTMTQSMMGASFAAPPPAAADAGLGFAADLEGAADALDDESAAEERDVEEEMLDIMEIDQVLEGMGDRGEGARNVFFEDL